ncbi:MAG: pitrilysin family protein [Patescibacteria group bacterium]|nr:pitrilysin family protein [Patescibacteria group bacterium]
MVPKKETKAVFVEIKLGAGSRYENKKNQGIAHFMEHMAFKGTKKRPTPLDISKEVDGVGGYINAYTGSDITGYEINLQSEKIELALDILSDMLINSKLDKNEIKKEKGVVLEEYKKVHDDPSRFAGLKFDELFYGDTPLGRLTLGTLETIKSIDRERILNFYKTFYNSDNIVIAIGGNINMEKTKKLLKKYFGSVKGKTLETFEKNHIVQRQPLIKIHKKDFKQSTLFMGFRSFGRGHKDRHIRQIILKVLGGYMSSKLFMEIREKKGLAYVISTWLDSLADTGCFGIYGGFDHNKIPDALKEVFKILRDAKQKGFKPEEIKMAKENTIGKLALSLEGAAGWASNIADNELYGLPIETPDEIIRETKKVTNTDIKRVARQIFRPENFNMVIVGPIDPREEKKYLDLIKL